MEDQIEQERTSKQTFLREEILEKGYEISLFQSYMESQKDDGLNIDCWSLEELKQVIYDFVRKYENNELKINNEPDPEEKEIQNKLEEKQNELGEEEKYGNNTSTIEKEEDDLVFESKCQKIRSDLINQENIKISIKKTENQKGGFFGMGRSHIVFLVHTSPYDWEVKRRFRDFIWLRDVLAKLFPGYLVPAMTKKRAGKANDEYYNTKKKTFLNMFVDLICETPELLYNEFTMAFLKLNDEKKLNLKKKESEYMTKPSKISEIINVEGTAHIKSTKENKIFTHYVGEYLNSAEPIYLNLKKKTKKLLLDLDEVTTTIFDLGKNFETLFQLANEANSRLSTSNFGSLSSMKDMYVSLNLMMFAWGNGLVKQANFMQTSLHEFLKFHYKQIGSYQELLKTNQYHKQEFLKFKLKLDAKKEKLFSLGDPYKWELAPLPPPLVPKDLLKNKKEAAKYMCAKDNIAQKNLELMFGYMNTQCYQEISKGIEIKNKRFSNNFKEVTLETVAIVDEFLKEWKNIMEITNITFESKASFSKDRVEKPFLRSSIRPSNNVEPDDSD